MTPALALPVRLRHPMYPGYPIATEMATAPGPTPWAVVLRRVIPRQYHAGLMALADGEEGRYTARVKGADARYSAVFNLEPPFGEPHRELLTQVQHHVWRATTMANVWGFELDDSWGQPIKVLRCDKGDGTRPHGDWDYMKGDRAKLTCIVLLNADYAGGELVVQERRLPIMRPGDGVFFPGFAMHCVLPVFRGRRYVLAAWRDGPAWR